MSGMLKQEFLLYTFYNEKELEKLVKQSIEIYNNKRPHLSLNNKTPNFLHEKTEVDIHFG